MGYDFALEYELFHEKNRDEYQRLIFKAGANDNYPHEPGAHIRDSYVHTLSHEADLKMDERTSESCIVYLNGQYWGDYTCIARNLPFYAPLGKNTVEPTH